MHPKLLVFDLDKTLLHSKNLITEYSINILNKCKQKGIKTAYATARSTYATSRITEMFKPDAFIGFSGSLTLYNNIEVCRYAISSKEADMLFAELVAEPAVEFIQATNGITAISNKTKPPDNWYWSKYLFNNFTQPINEPFFKITVQCNSPNAINKIAQNHPNCYVHRHSGENHYQFNHKDATKENALRALLAHLGVTSDEAVAFGDDLNDIGMIKLCGTGVAVGNALDNVKAAADYICDTNDNDGVAKWLENNLRLE